MAEMVIVNGRSYRKFIPFPGRVTDGTVRCFTCGQIDEPEFHDNKLCSMMISLRGSRKE